ncbi:hypothetical protein [Sinorhizobium meliloti]|uniref:hypothetical protein n=1 Tax=Rhizobium meliloti TaxID=382 RepID=UPI000FD6BF22|nr:hypothetical protein [Sinorhizobium meliloti]RVK38543.1 hypothetical protein CN163_14260 [Sinorhizobium meliloti]
MSGQLEELDWRLVVRGLKTKVDPNRKLSIEKVIREAAGAEVPLRGARRCLLLIAIDALGGRLRLVSVHGQGTVCLVALDDLLEVLAEPGPTLAEIMPDRGVGRK